MNITNKQEKENVLFSRKEITAKLDFRGATPSKIEVHQAFCKEFGTKDELSVVKEIITAFGTNQATVIFFVYSDAAVMARVEGLTMHRKIEEKLKAEADKAAEAQDKEEPAEVAKEDVPKEPVEEAKEEKAEKPAESKEEKEPEAEA